MVLRNSDLDFHSTVVVLVGVVLGVIHLLLAPITESLSPYDHRHWIPRNLRPTTRANHELRCRYHFRLDGTILPVMLFAVSITVLIFHSTRWGSLAVEIACHDLDLRNVAVVESYS